LDDFSSLALTVDPLGLPPLSRTVSAVIAIVDSVVIQEPTNVVTLDAIKWNNVSEDSINKVLIYVNGFLAKDGYFRQRNNFIFDSVQYLVKHLL
jgi:hypothetical protein